MIKTILIIYFLFILNYFSKILGKRFGFEKEGELKDFVFKNGKRKNVIIMGIINKYGNKN